MTYDPIDTSASDDSADSTVTVDDIDTTVLQGLNLDDAPAGNPVRIVEENGQTVFSARPPLIEDFESGNVSGWNFITSAGGSFSISNDSFNGSHAGDLEVTTGGSQSVAYFDSFGTRDFTQPFVLEAFVKDNNDGVETNQGIGVFYGPSDTEVISVHAWSRNGDANLQIEDEFNNILDSANPPINRNQYYKLRLVHDGNNTYTGQLFETNGLLLGTVTTSFAPKSGQNAAYVALTHWANGGSQHSTNYDDIKLQI